MSNATFPLRTVSITVKADVYAGLERMVAQLRSAGCQDVTVELLAGVLVPISLESWAEAFERTPLVRDQVIDLFVRGAFQ
jgi:hypothetical protein